VSTKEWNLSDKTFAYEWQKRQDVEDSMSELGPVASYLAETQWTPTSSEHEEWLRSNNVQNQLAEQAYWRWKNLLSQYGSLDDVAVPSRLWPPPTGTPVVVRLVDRNEFVRESAAGWPIPAQLRITEKDFAAHESTWRDREIPETKVSVHERLFELRDRLIDGAGRITLVYHEHVVETAPARDELQDKDKKPEPAEPVRRIVLID
jgi:hypothetical protein